MCAQQILNVGMKTSQTISMGTHMLPKKGWGKRGQRFFEVLYEGRLWSAWLCVGWMVGKGNPETREVSGTEWCEL